jgi:Flp pilus assembly protein TadD
MAMYKKAVELQPSAANYTRLGVSVFSLGHCEEAKTYYDKALALNPSQLTFYNLADAYRCLNQKTEATKYYQLAIDRALRNLQVNPKDATTLSLLGLYYAKKGDAVRGREFARRARSLDPKDVQILYQSAVAAALGGDKRESLDLLAQAIQKGYSRMEAANDRDLNSISADPEFKKLIQ